MPLPNNKFDSTLNRTLMTVDRNNRSNARAQLTDRARPTLITPRLSLSSSPQLALPLFAYLAFVLCTSFFFFLVLVCLSLCSSLSSFPPPTSRFILSLSPAGFFVPLPCREPLSLQFSPSSPSFPFLFSRCALSSARRLKARRRISRTKRQ